MPHSELKWEISAYDNGSSIQSASLAALNCAGITKAVITAFVLLD